MDNTLRLLTSGPRDVPARQQTLRATISWSYNILTAEERLLFRSLSVFAGGFSLESAELLVVLGHIELNGADLLELIAALVDHSLVQRSTVESSVSRWSMLNVIREFGINLLEEGGELATLREIHAEVMAATVAGAETGLYESAQVEWLRKLAEEEGNVRSALAWAMENGQRDVGLRIAGPIWRFWSFQHRGEDGRTWLKNLLALPGEASPVATGLALRGAGCLAEDIGDYDSATRYHQAAKDIWREIADLPRLSRTLDDLGNVAHDQGHFDEAIALHNQALELAKSCGYNRGVIRSLSNLGATAYLQGDLNTAKRRWQEAIDSGIIDDPISQAMMFNNLGVACMQLGDLDLASAHLNKALAIHQKIGTQSTTADVYINLSDIAMRKGEFERYRSYFDEATELYRKADDPKGLHNAFFSLGATALERGDTGEALTSFAESLRYADRANNRLGIADAISRIAGIAAEYGRLQDAALLIGIEDSLRRKMNSVPLPAQLTQIEELQERVKNELGTAAFAETYQRGQETSQRQAVSLSIELATELTLLRPTLERREKSGETNTALFRLTKRETEVLKLLAEGMTDRDIAVALWISPRTAGTHVANILGKLEVDTRAAAVAAAFRHKILSS